MTIFNIVVSDQLLLSDYHVHLAVRLSTFLWRFRCHAPQQCSIFGIILGGTKAMQSDE